MRYRLQLWCIVDRVVALSQSRPGAEADPVKIVRVRERESGGAFSHLPAANSQ